MSGWAAFGLHLALASLIAIAVVVLAVRRQRLRPETRDVIPALFPWLEERRDYASALSIARYARHRPPAWGILVFAAAPTVAAFAVAFVGADESDLRSVVARLAPVAGDAAIGPAVATYAVVVAVFVVVASVYLRVAAGAPTPPAFLHGRSLRRTWARLVGGMFTDEGGTLEEIGWRGLSLPAVVAATGSLGWATVLVAVAWWAWHLPREVPGLVAGASRPRFARLQAEFLLLCLALSVLMTAGWHHTGSVWPAILIHGGTNVWSKALGAPMWERTGRDVRTVVVVAFATVVVVVASVG